MLILIIVLAVDAFRTLVESVYFGLMHTSEAGMLPEALHAFMSQPQYFFIPKILNLASALLIITLLFWRWMPQATEARRQSLAQISALEHEHRIAQEAMEQRNKFLVNFMETAPIAITVYDSDGLMVRANDAWKTMWNIDDIREVLGHFNALTDQQSQGNGMSAIFKRVLEEQQHGKFEGKFIPMESGMPGDAKMVSVSLYPMVVAGEVYRVISINVDLTEEYRRSAEQKRRAHNQGALEMAGAACHELNQPLQVVMAQLDMLAESPDEAAAQRRVDTMRGEVQRMAGIIRKMEDLTTVKTMDYLGETRIIDINGSRGKGDG